ncbi:hypothetical protein BJ138DRAFT_1123419 [Hygrophoropsis aurantiaca]|uniref:Uncharacterized protein n=1 Tax=Hygrophoropsis aurantiaca TaxID=72124 RepID=A0ACB8AMN3_9AGAM|nr:hypothetical protein BJ138DRAFT_1123419 [Hygrophoropsis aurantiaca]
MAKLEAQVNGIHDEQNETRIEVNQRALVDKILARYPEEFTVFRELLQNADDARANSVEIHFRTEGSTNGATGANGKASELPDLINTPVHTWMVRNDGDPFEEGGWARLTKIADGNPDEGKIGAFGVGFYSVFSVTDEPIVTSGDGRKTIFYIGDQVQFPLNIHATYLTSDQLWVRHQTNPRRNDKWTTIDMKLRKPAPCPKPFDLTRFLVSSMTFMANLRVATIYLDDRELSSVKKTRGEPDSLDIPSHFTRKSQRENMNITGVEVTKQEIQAEFMRWIYSAGSSNKPTASRALPDSDTLNLTKTTSFWEPDKPEPHSKKARASTLPQPPLPSTEGNISYRAEYFVYSAIVAVEPCKEMEEGLRSATLKDPPKSLKYDMVHFSKEEYDKRAEEEKHNSSTGSIFRGPQGLCPELHGDHPARIFIGHSTSQTTGIGGHMASRFIPTVERGAVDLANGEVAKWNEELLYIGGFIARLVYENEMEKIQADWPSNDGVPQRLGPDDPHYKQALYAMKCFTFHNSTPDVKVGRILQANFFDCSAGDDFPILSTRGIRYTKNIRMPADDFAPFMRDMPILPPELVVGGSNLNKISMIPDLPGYCEVPQFKFRDVLNEVEARVFRAEEMAACIRWWVTTFTKRFEGDPDRHIKAREKFMKFSRTAMPKSSSGKELRLEDIELFVDPDGQGTFITPDDPLPPNTIPLFFTNRINPDMIKTSLGWKEMTAVDWIRYLTTDELPFEHNMHTNHQWAEHVLVALTSARGKRIWSSLPDEDRVAIKELMEVVPCIPTNKGLQLPKDSYFPTADVFKDLPTVTLPPFNEDYGKMLEELGVQRFLELPKLLQRASETAGWTNYDMIRYLVTVEDLDKDQVQDAAIFFSAADQPHKIDELYEPQLTFRTLQLPVLTWPDRSFAAAENKLLTELKLRRHPPLDVVINLASHSDGHIREAALTYFLANHDEHYEEYEPGQFSNIAFIPALTNGGEACVGTPEQVFLDDHWTIMGFYKLDTGKIDRKKAMRLKIQKRPSASNVISLLEKTPPPDDATARLWFEFLATYGGFASDDLQKLKGIAIVPVQKIDATNPELSTISLIPPDQCFLSNPEKPQEHFYARLFTFVDFGTHANEFLKICGTKPHPSCVDIAHALLQDPQKFLDAADEKEYRKELYQIALQQKMLPSDVEENMMEAPLFLGYRDCAPDATEGEVPFPQIRKEFLLKRANEIVIADDMESYGLFADRVFVAPQEDRLEEFYAGMGSKPLSAFVTQTVKPFEPCHQPTRAEEYRELILKRMRLFLHGNNSSLKPDHPFAGLEAGSKFVVMTCEKLEITKTLDIKGDKCSKPVHVPVGIMQADDGTTQLWLIEGTKPDWYDVAAALCRVVLEKPKAHDSLLLMTMLDTDIEILKKRGYDVDRIEAEHAKAVAAELAEKEKAQENISEEREHHQRNLYLLFFLRPWFTMPARRVRRRPVRLDTLDTSVDEAMGMCSGEGKTSSVLRNQEHQNSGKKKRDVEYCTQRKMTNIKESPCSPVKGIKIYEAEKLQSPLPAAALDVFARIINRLATRVFQLELEAFHIFWAPSDKSLMGFNRNHGAIYLNLAHYEATQYKTGNHHEAFIAW